MTAEVAVMNKQAVALATDSAATITLISGHKTYNTVNKLFCLSKYQPIGIMVYGSASFMGVPWETVIKIYRTSLGQTKFSTVKEYAKDFFKFLSKNYNRLFPKEVRLFHFYQTLIGYFGEVLSIINLITEKIIEASNINEDEVIVLAGEITKKYHKDINNCKTISKGLKEASEEIYKDQPNFIKNAIEEVFQALPLNNNAKKMLEKIAKLVFYKKTALLNTPGVVFAGFGENEIYPNLCNYIVEILLNKHLKYFHLGDCIISEEVPSYIKPFAQSEMVYSFMEGIDPTFDKVFKGYAKGMLENYGEQVIEFLESDNSQLSDELKKRIRSEAGKFHAAFEKDCQDYRDEYHSTPVMGAVQHLPKDELATMAETLISLTSFKRRVTLTPETVGGAIDVAVISKGDGFIWIKRKHYFKPELNPQFFANYYRETSKSNGGKNDKNQE